jgi:hypothetical protein
MQAQSDSFATKDYLTAASVHLLGATRFRHRIPHCCQWDCHQVVLLPLEDIIVVKLYAAALPGQQQ